MKWVELQDIQLGQHTSIRQWNCVVHCYYILYKLHFTVLQFTAGLEELWSSKVKTIDFMVIGPIEFHNNDRPNSYRDRGGLDS